MIILLENAFNEGWTNLSSKVESFIDDDLQIQELNAKTGEASTKGDTGKGSNRDAIHRNRWSANASFPTLKKSITEGENPLRRSLVGSFPDCDKIPTRNDLRKWVQQTWKGIFNIQISV